MPASEPLPVVISCPHCGTRYQIPYTAIGAKGRSVLCAQCGRSWEARAPAPPKPAPVAADTPLDALAEEVLDQQFTTEARLDEIIRAFEDNGCPIFNPHRYTLEEGGMKQTDAVQLAFKREADPLGLLNPGKMIAWENPDYDYRSGRTFLFRGLERTAK